MDYTAYSDTSAFGSSSSHVRSSHNNDPFFGMGGFGSAFGGFPGFRMDVGGNTGYFRNPFTHNYPTTSVLKVIISIWCFF